METVVNFYLKMPHFSSLFANGLQQPPPPIEKTVYIPLDFVQLHEIGIFISTQLGSSVYRSVTDSVIPVGLGA